MQLEGGSGSGLEHFKGGIDVGNDRRTVTAHHLPESAGDMWTDGAGGKDILGEDDAIHHVGGA